MTTLNQNDTTKTAREIIENHPVYARILADSFGGVIYNVANRDTYDTTGTLELIALWETMPDYQRDSCNGILTGAMNFITGN
tara:strand:+ start:1475 stop:1720 length:246 start_codon:yes stop_codon:yes gene_type:complete